MSARPYYNLNVRLSKEMYDFLERKKINKSKFVRSYIKNYMDFDMGHIKEEKAQLREQMSELDERLAVAREKEEEQKEHLECVADDYYKWGRATLSPHKNLGWLHNRYIDRLHSVGVFVTDKELLQYCMEHPR